MKESGEFLSEH